MATEHLDLVTLRQLAEELGFRCAMSSSDALAVNVCGEARLCFVNLPNDDVLVGFEGTEWHAHAPFIVETGGGRFVEHDETTLLAAIAAGDLLIVETRLSGVVTNRHLIDRREALDTRGLVPGEELRVLASDVFNASG